MKTTFLILVTAFFSFKGLAQDFFAKAGWGISIYQEEHSFMANYTNFNEEVDEIDFEFAPTILVQMGLNFKLSEKLNIAPVIYPSIGLWFHENSMNETLLFYAIEIPISAELYLGNRDKIHSFVGAGFNYLYYSQSNYAGAYPGITTNVDTGPVIIYGPQFTLGLNYNLGVIDALDKFRTSKNTWKISYTIPMNSPKSIPELNFTKHRYVRNLTMSLLWRIN